MTVGKPPLPALALILILFVLFVLLLSHENRSDQCRKADELGEAICRLAPFPQRPPIRPIRRHRPIDPFGELDIRRIDQDPPDQETDGKHCRGDNCEGNSACAMAAEQHREHYQRDDGGDLSEHSERTGKGVEAALHCGSHPEILVPGHARRQLHEMAEAEAKRERGEHDRRETNEAECHGVPLFAGPYSSALFSDSSAPSATLKRRTVRLSISTSRRRALR